MFDPNVFAIATGIEEHNNYGVDFIEAARTIRATLPHAHISGGVSNLSFSFRGNEPVREAMHAVFLYHAIQAGMDMGIVNAGQLAVYDEIDPELREACEDVVLNRRADGTERLLTIAERYRGAAGKEAKAQDLAWREEPVDKRIAHALVNGITEYHRGRHRGGAPSGQAPARRDRGPADGGDEPRRRPVWRGQDVPAAGGEVGAGDEAGGGDPAALHGGREGGRRSAQTAGTIVLATVKGDVHDIGKNIVGVVLACNNYEIIDLGVMTPASKILAVARERKADAIGLSGLITPSLDEMVHVAAEMEREGFDIPLLIGGATTSRVHTAVKIHPRYARSQAVHVNDASRAVGVVASLALVEETRAATIAADPRRVPQGDRGARAERSREDPRAARESARQRVRRRLERLSADEAELPRERGCSRAYDLADLARHIDWTPFFQTWELKGRYPAILDDPEQGAAARVPVRRRAGDAEADHRREVASAQGGGRLLAGGARGRRHRAVRRRRARKTGSPRSTPCASSSAKRDGQPESGARRFRRPAATTSAASW